MVTAEICLRNDLTVDSASEALADVTGWTLPELLATHNSLREALHGEDTTLLEELVLEARSRGTASGDLRLRDPDGRFRVLVCELSVESVADTAVCMRLSDARSLESRLDVFPSPMTAVIMESTDDFIFFKDDHHILLTASQSMVSLCEPVDHWSEFAGKSDYDLFPEALADNYYELETRVYGSGEMAREVQPTLTEDGRPGWVDNRKYPIRNDAGQIIGLYGIARDITDQVHAMQSQSLAASVFENAAESIAILDAAGNTVDVNRAFLDSSGYAREQVLGRSPRYLKHAEESNEQYERRWSELLNAGSWQGELESIDARGQRHTELARFSAVRNEHRELTHVVCIYSDITLLKRHEQELEAIAHYDVLTGLANRSLFGDRLNQAIASSSRRNSHLAIAYIDIDRFKQVNDQLGHEAGDRYLGIIAARMKTALRETDTLARLGGDEFVALITDLRDDLEFRAVVDRLLQAAAGSVEIDRSTVSCSASIGVSRYPHDGLEGDLLMRRADQAMYMAKQQGKNQAYIFERGDMVGIEAREDMLNAIRRREFRLLYQPKVHMGSGEILGVEALIRWQHPDRGLLRPLEFLSLVDRENLTIELGEWVIDEALRQDREWTSQGLALPISVNISGIQLQQPGFLEALSLRLDETRDSDAAALEFEILESSALNDLATIAARVARGKSLGLQFALDDFGTGFSSLTHLRQLPVSTVKIDRSFVRDMLEDPDDLAIVTSIIGLCSGLGRHCIAEGVSSARHAQALLALGCNYGQGYAIARPLEPDQVPSWREDWQRSQSWLRFRVPDTAPEDQDSPPAISLISSSR